MTRARTLVLLFLLPSLASPAFAGWTLTQVATQSGDGGGSNVTQRISFEGAAAKIELSGVESPMFEPGSYLLVRDGGAKILVVNPARKTYAVLDPRAMAQGAAAMAGSGPEMRIEDPKIVKLLEEPGGEMLGRPTTHYRYRTTYAMVMSMAPGMETRMAMDILEDVWTAPAIEAGGTGRALGALGALATMGGGQPELGELEKQVKSTLVGLPLKQVTVTDSKPDSKGLMGRLTNRAAAATRQTTTLLVTELAEATLPASTFQVPPGYSETEMMQRGPAMPDLGDGN